MKRIPIYKGTFKIVSTKVNDFFEFRIIYSDDQDYTVGHFRYRERNVDKIKKNIESVKKKFRCIRIKYIDNVKESNDKLYINFYGTVIEININTTYVYKKYDILTTLQSLESFKNIIGEEGVIILSSRSECLIEKEGYLSALPAELWNELSHYIKDKLTLQLKVFSDEIIFYSPLCRFRLQPTETKFFQDDNISITKINDIKVIINGCNIIVENKNIVFRQF